MVDAEMIALLKAFSSGGGSGAGTEGFDFLSRCTTLPVFNITKITDFPDPCTIDAPNCNSVNTLFNCTSVNFETLELNLGANPITLNQVVGTGGWKPSGVKVVRIRSNGAETIKFPANTVINYTFSSPTLHTIDCILDLSSYNKTCSNWIGSAMENMRFVANTIKVSCNWAASAVLSDGTLASIANGLYDGSALTITLHADSKARCDAILGTVSSVTDDSGTYDFFSADESGDTTLTEFITNVKGWTLA
ncbi:MAG: hypothetical protein ACI3V3_04230 [Faecousia sp.]